MSVVCPACGYDKNPENSEFCDACGSELPTSVTDTIESEPPVSTPLSEVNEEPPISESPVSESDIPASTDILSPISSSTASARLVAKQTGAPTSEFPVSGRGAVIGIFDPDMGPVDVDLDGFTGCDTVSRNHAEIYEENGEWKIKDLGSTNGVFIKPTGQSRFGTRINTPTTLNIGDEVAIAKVTFLFQDS